MCQQWVALQPPQNLPGPQEALPPRPILGLAGRQAGKRVGAPKQPKVALMASWFRILFCIVPACCFSNPPLKDRSSL